MTVTSERATLAPAALSPLALAALALTALAGPASAQATGDAEAGATAFDRQCVSCHVVADAAGEVLAGRSAMTGPNLYGVAGRVPGSVPDFAYSEAMVLYGETGVGWDEASFVGYVMDPSGWLRAHVEGERLRSKMAYQVRDEQDAHDLYAFLASLGGTGAEIGARDAAGEAAATE